MDDMMGHPDSPSRMKDSFLQLVGVLPLLRKTALSKGTPASGDSPHATTDGFIQGYQFWPLYPTMIPRKGHPNIRTLQFLITAQLLPLPIPLLPLPFNGVDWSPKHS